MGEVLVKNNWKIILSLLSIFLGVANAYVYLNNLDYLYLLFSALASFCLPIVIFTDIKYKYYFVLLPLILQGVYAIYNVFTKDNNLVLIMCDVSLLLIAVLMWTKVYKSCDKYQLFVIILLSLVLVGYTYLLGKVVISTRNAVIALDNLKQVFNTESTSGIFDYYSLYRVVFNQIISKLFPTLTLIITSLFIGRKD